MKILILLGLVALANARVLNKNDCGVILNGISHEKVVLKEYVDKPYQLSINYNTNILYFTYAIKGGADFEAGYLNLKTNEFGTITGVEGPFATAVDEKTGTVYIGGGDGIYKLNPDMKSATKLEVTDKNIWQLFAKDGLYFSTYPNEEAYLYKNGQVRKVTEIGDTRAMLIAEDKAQNIYFTNSSGVFCYTKQEGKVVHISEHTINAFASNIDGKLFFSTPTGIFSIDEKTREVKPLAAIINIYGMAVESDGSIIYSSENSVIRLKSTGKECFD